MICRRFPTLLSWPPCFLQLHKNQQYHKTGTEESTGSWHLASMFFHLNSSEHPGPTGSTPVLPGPIWVHPGPIFLGLGPTLCLGSKNLIHSDVGSMHGLFDHRPVFSVAVQIISNRGVQLPVAWTWKSVIC